MAKIKRKCSKCNGTGTTLKTCPSCNGKGEYTILELQGPNAGEMKTVTCAKCHGNKHVSDICSECSGIGQVETSE